jgi:hypothetical protein
MMLRFRIIEKKIGTLMNNFQGESIKANMLFDNSGWSSLATIFHPLEVDSFWPLGSAFCALAFL